jgi:hypothetical protein
MVNHLSKVNQKQATLFIHDVVGFDIVMDKLLVGQFGQPLQDWAESNQQLQERGWGTAQRCLVLKDIFQVLPGIWINNLFVVGRTHAGFSQVTFVKLVVLAEVLDVAGGEHRNSEFTLWVNLCLNNVCNLVFLVKILGPIEDFSNSVWDVVYVPTLQVRCEDATICSTIDELSTMMFIAL